MLALGAGILLVAGCKKDVVYACAADLRYSMKPADTSIAVGTKFTAKLTYLGCAGTTILSDTIRYSVSDPTIISVDSVSGVVTALRPGFALLAGSGKVYRLVVTATVAVR